MGPSQPSTSRREFMVRAAALGCSAAASPLITPVVFASAPVDTRLVVIILRGAMDGLDVVQPYGDPDLSGWRKSFSLGPEGGAHDLDGFYALHPELGDLMPLWKAGELGIVHAVSTPYRNKRSHFDGQDFLENGGGAPNGSLTPAEDGWLNRLLPLMGGITEKTAFSVGVERLRLVSGQAPHSSWSPGAGMEMSAQGQALLEAIYAQDPLFRDAARRAAELSKMGGSMSGGMGGKMNPVRAGQAKALAAFAAERLNEETRIAAFSLGGFDTHRLQRVTLPRALKELRAALLGLKEGLGANWEKTAVLAVTEFGRTVAENGSSGSDHGTGGVMITAGGAIRGGQVLGRWPGLQEADLFGRRDLMPTDDLRRYAGHVMRGLFGVAASDIAATVFPGVDMGYEPGLIL